jgi:HlyD family secretion protein
MGSVPSQVEPPPGASPHSGSARTKWVRRAAVAFSLLAIAVGVLVWRTHRNQAIQYETVPVERGSVQSRVTATGTLNAVVQVLVSSQVSGNIKALYADWNSKVRKGQLVALIDPEVFRAQLDQATASARSAHAATLITQAQLAKSHADLSAASASEKTAEATAAKDFATALNASQQWQRASRLFQQGIVSREAHDTAWANWQAARGQSAADVAQVKAAQEAVRSAQASVQVAKHQLASAEAQEHQAEASQRQAQINLDRTRITAPVDGTVVARRMDVGQTVASTLNPPTIFEIAQDLTKMQVDTNVDESDIGKIAPGQRATFVVDAYPGLSFDGRVSEIRKAPIVAQNVVTYDVVISVDNSGLRLFPGMTANVTVLTSRADDTLKVPTSVLRFRPSSAVLRQNRLAAPQPDKAYVYVLAAGKLKPVEVRFGISDGRYTALASSGLHAGDRLVVRATSRENNTSNSRVQAGPRMPRM